YEPGVWVDDATTKSVKSAFQRMDALSLIVRRFGPVNCAPCRPLYVARPGSWPAVAVASLPLPDMSFHDETWFSGSSTSESLRSQSARPSRSAGDHTCGAASAVASFPASATVGGDTVPVVVGVAPDEDDDDDVFPGGLFVALSSLEQATATALAS